MRKLLIAFCIAAIVVLLVMILFLNGVSDSAQNETAFLEILIIIFGLIIVYAWLFSEPKG